MEQLNFKLIVGLGNPGKQYEGTYHNVGSEAVRMIINKNSADKHFSIWNGCFFEQGQKESIVYLIPVVYMNESGSAILETTKQFKITPDKILVIHDDSDIEVGKYKLSRGQGSAGHSGVQSIIRSLGTKDFWRLRVGVRGINTGKAGDFVLRKITSADKAKIKKVLLEIQVSYSK